ncbi:rhodanese-like domain-containing protein [Ruegeria sp. 2205SS24-7]|uniref:rhodanese-like domain-containing protein n=1 Tax=Ruegeria discodermiae TaxID=3064389 RepID=UPI0027415166|nr:rhodanese-like domain-containing protein [Ruegeria sp. 2205SS24-7]MDP5219860.1 rhodanese-like domain-containing protein [Ruegeria sp. 2205SS24-7]
MEYTQVNSHTVVDELHPLEVWDALKAIPDAVMVDVRTHPEWHFVGRPDLSSIDRRLLCVEWHIWPRMTQNLGFLSDLLDDLGDEMPARLFFLCRAGPRAISAADEFSRQMQARGVSVHCTNVAFGMEGEMNAQGHRGLVNGWKKAGLPWKQD